MMAAFKNEPGAGVTTNGPRWAPLQMTMSGLNLAAMAVEHPSRRVGYVEMVTVSFCGRGLCLTRRGEKTVMGFEEIRSAHLATIGGIDKPPYLLLDLVPKDGGRILRFATRNLSAMAMVPDPSTSPEVLLYLARSADPSFRGNSQATCPPHPVYATMAAYEQATYYC